MKINAGVWDRIARFVFALVFFVVGSLYVAGYARLLFYVLSLILVITSTSGFCAMYEVFKIDTTSKKKK